MCRKNGLVEKSTHVTRMLDDPSYISQGTLHFAYDKIMVPSIEDSIVAVTVLDHLNVSREKQNIILNKEQETAVKERLVFGRTVQINTAIWIYDQYLKLSGLLTTQIFYIQLYREVWNTKW